MIRSVHAAQKLSLPPSRPVNMQLGSYEPCFEIGSGGMASVYIAREHGHSGLQRTVALKVMHEHLARRDEFKNRFLDEARVLTQIAHPFVCRVVGYGEDSGRPFMAMEYLIGEPLSRILRAMKRRGQSLTTARRARLFARVVADLAEGLHSAHEARDYEGKPMGVVHRDITPHNLFLLYDGTVRVLDFGIARFADRNVHTVSNALLGKLPYMAPEQMQGEGYDRRVDVWALGVVLWELVTLGRLFKRETEIRTMRAVCTDRIPSLAEFTPDVPAGLEQVIGRALQREPNERYPTARALSHALEMWLGSTGEPVTHGETSEFLNGFFPGSQLERQRWAQQSSPAGSGVRRAIGSGSEEGSLSQPNPFAERGPETHSAAPGQTEPEPVTSEYVHPERPGSARLVSALTNVPDDDAEVTVKRHVPPLESVTKDLRARADTTVNAGPTSDSTRIGVASVPPQRPASRAGWLTGFAAVALFVSTLAVAHLGQKHTAAGSVAAPSAERGRLFAGVAEPVGPDAPLARAAALSELAPSPEAEGETGTEVAAPESVVHSSRAEGTSGVALTTHPTPAKVADATVTKPKQAPPVSPAPKRAVDRTPPRITAPPAAFEPAPTPSPAAAATGDVLIVSSTPGVKVFLGSRLLGTTPVKTRLPAGPALLSLQVGTATDRIPMSAQIAPGRLNMLSVNLSR